MRSVKQECLNRMVLLGRNALERALREYRLHYLRERYHQGLGNRLLDDFPQDADGPASRAASDSAAYFVITIVRLPE